MRAVLRAVHVRDVKAVWPVHCGDAAETAIRFGRTQAYVGSALGVLQNFVDLRSGGGYHTGFNRRAQISQIFLL